MSNDIPFNTPTADPVTDDTATDNAATDATPPPPPPAPQVAGPRRIVRDPNTRLGGVASGLAHHFNLDVSIVRILFCIAFFINGLGLVAYLAAWLILPRADEFTAVAHASPVPPLNQL